MLITSYLPLYDPWFTGWTLDCPFDESSNIPYWDLDYSPYLEVVRSVSSVST
jgi:hypothetical protein